jgi:hypothetical protein
MRVSLDESVLHLSEHSGDASPVRGQAPYGQIEEDVEQLVAKKYPPGVAEQDPVVAEQPSRGPSCNRTMVLARILPTLVATDLD